MKRKNKILIILISLLILIGCEKKLDISEQKSYDNTMKEIRVEDLKYDMQIIDIRHPDLYIGWKNNMGNKGHIKGALDFPEVWFKYENNIENLEIELKRRNIDKNKPTVIYSDDDIGEKTYNLYLDLGFKDLYVLKGGFNKYSELGLDIELLEGHKMYVGTQWLEDLINGKNPEHYDNNENYKIVEIGFDKEKYDEGHIKGAIYLDPDDINQIPGPRNLSDYELIPIDKQLEFWGFPDDEDIKMILEDVGIDKDTTVILYADEKATTAANRTALVMDYAGVKDIRLLNGGKTLWELENRELVKDKTNLEKVDFGVDVPANPEIVFTYEQELSFVEDRNSVVASVRSWDEYLGRVSGYTYIGEAGDIKNSRFAYAGSDPYAMEDYRNLDNTMFNYKIIEDRWERWGITGDKLVSFHCGTGWRAAETYYIAKALGWENIGVYVGGWYEWHKREGSPVMDKGLPEDAPEDKPEQYFYK